MLFAGNLGDGYVGMGSVSLSHFTHLGRTDEFPFGWTLFGWVKLSR